MTLRASLRLGAAESVAAAAVVVMVALIGSAWLSVLLMQAAAGSDHAAARLLVDAGGPKVMRRIFLILLILALPTLLRRMGWQGWSDCGWSDVPGRKVDPRWARDVRNGMLIGTASLGVLVVVAQTMGTRHLADASMWFRELPGVAAYAGAAMVIGVIEETVARGVLFRVLSRRWRVWPAALASSLLFSFAHFFRADEAAYGAGSVGWQTVQVVATSFGGLAATPEFAVRFANLAVMGVVLCLFVARTRTVWMAIGMHAAWVWMRRLHAVMTDRTEGVLHGGWIGNRSDMTDSLIALLVFAALAAVAMGGERGEPERRAAADE